VTQRAKLYKIYTNKRQGKIMDVCKDDFGHLKRSRQNVYKDIIFCITMGVKMAAFIEVKIR
jgi:hypothetical protein